MPTIGKFISNLRQIWIFISNKRKQQLSLLIALSLVSAFAEIITIGLVVPFLAVLTNPQVLTEFEHINKFMKYLNYDPTNLSVLGVSIFFAVAALLSGLIRVFMIYATVRFSFATGSDLALKMYSKVLNQDFKTHINRNSSQIVDIVFQKINLVIQNVIVTSITLISSIIIISVIFMFLLFIKPFVTIGTLLVLGLSYSILIKFTRNRVYSNSTLIAKNSNLVIKNIQEGVAGIREILLTGTQKLFIQKFNNVESPLRRSQADNSFISFSPRYIMETVGILLLVALAYFLHSQGGLGSSITLLGVLALTSQRLLPLVNQSYFSYTSIRGEQVSLEDVIDLLSQPQIIFEKDSNDLKFEESVILENISFSYDAEKNVLSNINLKITKGSKVGIIGASASGKSTLADVIACLLIPDSGSIKIDNKSLDKVSFNQWQNKVSYVSQAIFLNDNTIAENIAFGEIKSDINMERVKMCAHKSQLANAIEKLPHKYNTVIGEKGTKLSGGQKQRLAIARALYRESTFLILDEATSALDHETEKLVMDSIMGLDKDITILIIAHRTTTLAGCDIITELKNGEITYIGNYNNLMRQN
tara:strand:+ start:5488 stop:7251 length:1764 start_codon:yes stop_codon:yes gene_type:complete